MDIRISVTSKEGFGRPLRLEAFGLCVELADLAGDSTLVLCEGPDGVTVRLAGTQGAQYVAADTTGQVDAGETASSGAANDSETVGDETVSSESADGSETVGGETVSSETVSSETADGSETPEGSEEQQKRLFQELTALRKRIASEAGLPPYVIFHDSTLKEMCRVLPPDLESLYSVQGVGKAKLEKYGALFISAIREHTEAA